MILCAEYCITGDGKTVLKGQAALLDEEGKIRELGPREEILSRFPEEPVKDMGEATMLPGLCDMHVHLGYWFSQPDGFNYNEYLKAAFAIQHAQAAFEKGITSVRDMTSERKLCATLKLAEEKGFLVLPRITHVDNGICMTGGHGHGEVDGPWEIRKEIRRQIRDGAEWVKVLTTHRTHTPEFTQEELNTAVEECHRRGVKCGVHAGTQPGIQMSIDAGFDTIEHGTFMSTEQAFAMREKGIAWIPTILPYAELYEAARSAPPSSAQAENLRFYQETMEVYHTKFLSLAETGILIGAGTDLIISNGESDPFVARELEYMVECGFNCLQAIQAGTSNGARILGLEDVTGQIVPGLMADLLIVDGDPTTRIGDLRHVRQVLLAGQTVYQKS